MSLLSSIENIYLQAQKSKLHPILIKEDMALLNKYLGKGRKLNMIESMCFATILVKNVESESNVNLYELALDFTISPLAATAQILPAIEALLKKGLITQSISKRRASEILRQKYYTVEATLIDAIISEKPMPDLKQTVWESSLDVLNEILITAKNLHAGSGQKEDVYATIQQIIENPSATKFKFISWINKEAKLKDESLLVFCHIVYESLNGASSVEFKEFSQILFKKQVAQILFVQKIINGESYLITNDLIKIHKTAFLEDIELQLTSKTIAALAEENLIVIVNDQYITKDLILPENISAQTLFYNSEVENKIAELHQFLEEAKYEQLMQRLKEKNLPQLISVILYGPPGSGKTELSKQLAAQSNRAIMSVDLSKVKSAYYGETEKKIKRIFSDYDKLVRSSNGLEPILLLNEADGILRNRTEINSSSNVASTEHLLITVLLQCLEDASGIIIATTNLITNLDAAFNRRFLFKLELNEPSLLVRSKIVKDKIQHLTDEQAVALARTYSATGGQISNVFKKSEFHYILNGEPAPFEIIQSFFDEELSLQQGTNKIGF